MPAAEAIDDALIDRNRSCHKFEFVWNPMPRAARSPPRARPAPSASAAPAAKHEPVVWGDYVPHDHLSAKNLGNAFLCAIALTPSFGTLARLFQTCDVARPAGDVCILWATAPIAFANVLFFVNVSVGFWLVGLVQRSFWLIDPYWTIIPPLLGHYYRAHPRSVYDANRSFAVLGLLWLWSWRLTHSYFRREGWKFGEREDWRYTKMARDMPRLWPLLSFFAVGLAQQPMLVGITLPAASAHQVAAPLGPLDLLAVAGCVLGLLVAWSADNELAEYMAVPPKVRTAVEPVLRGGLWGYSRHPNYFGEITFWTSFSLFSVGLGQPAMLVGTAFNTCVLLAVSLMTEERMLSRWLPARAALYREYMRVTSPIVLWPQRA